MSRDNVSTPERGGTWYSGRTIDTANYEGVEVEGTTKCFEDKNWNAAGVKTDRLSPRMVTCRLVRNVSGVTIYAKRLVQLDPTNPNRVLGYASTLFGESYPADEYLPAGGVPNGDLFWIVVGGPAVCLTGFAGADFNSVSIAAGDILGSGTQAASTGAGTTGVAGRIAGVLAVNVALTTNTQYNELLRYAHNPLGRALSAKTSGNTHADILVDVGWRRGGGYP